MRALFKIATIFTVFIFIFKRHNLQGIRIYFSMSQSARYPHVCPSVRPSVRPCTQFSGFSKTAPTISPKFFLQIRGVILRNFFLLHFPGKIRFFEIKNKNWKKCHALIKIFKSRKIAFDFLTNKQSKQKKNPDTIRPCRSWCGIYHWISSSIFFFFHEIGVPALYTCLNHLYFTWFYRPFEVYIR